jgi:hypothetical protein
VVPEPQDVSRDAVHLNPRSRTPRARGPHPGRVRGAAGGLKEREKT